jgi:excinuclease UvrABC nuclease subunit
VTAAIRFFDGTSTEPIDKLQVLMAEASARLDFERAASYRDQLLHLRWLGERLASLRQSRAQYDFIYRPSAKLSLNGSHSSECWYFIRSGQVVGVISAPVNEDERRLAVEHIARFQKLSAGPGHPSVETVFLVAAWFRRHPQERLRTQQPQDAISLLH